MQGITILAKQYSRAIGGAFTSQVVLERLRLMWADALILALLVAGAFSLSFVGSGQFHPVIFDDNHAKNILFDADPARVVEVMTTRLSGFHRFSFTHPLFSLIAYPPVYLLKTALGIEPTVAVRIAFAFVAAVWVISLFIILRIIGCRRFDALLFTLMGMSTAAATFWLVVPETYSFGSVTILWAAALVALAQYRPVSPVWYVFASAFSLSITVTNWMAGILATIVKIPWRQSLQITVNAFCIVVALWVVQKLFFPSSVFFIAHWNPSQFIFAPETGGFLNILKVFVCDTIVMPSINSVRWGSPEISPALSIQSSLPGSGSLWGAIGLIFWLALLGLGIWGLFSLKLHFQLRIFLGLLIVGQIALHAVFGRETFLYSLNFAPLLVLLAALSTLTRARIVALFFAGAVTLAAGVNNGMQFKIAASYVQTRAISGQ